MRHLRRNRLPPTLRFVCVLRVVLPMIRHHDSAPHAASRLQPIPVLLSKPSAQTLFRRAPLRQVLLRRLLLRHRRRLPHRCRRCRRLHHQMLTQQLSRLHRCLRLRLRRLHRYRYLHLLRHQCRLRSLFNLWHFRHRSCRLRLRLRRLRRCPSQRRLLPRQPLLIPMVQALLRAPVGRTRAVVLSWLLLLVSLSLR